MSLFKREEVRDGYIPGIISRWLILEKSGNDFSRVGASDTQRPDPPFQGTTLHLCQLWTLIYLAQLFFQFYFASI